MHRIEAKFVARLLTNDQKEHRINAYTEFKNLVSKDENERSLGMRE